MLLLLEDITGILNKEKLDELFKVYEIFVVLKTTGFGLYVILIASIVIVPL